MNMPWKCPRSRSWARLVQCERVLKEEERSEGCRQRPGDWWPEPDGVVLVMVVGESIGRLSLTHFYKGIEDELLLGRTGGDVAAVGIGMVGAILEGMVSMFSTIWYGCTVDACHCEE